MIAASGLRKDYGAVQALAGFTAEIPQGQFVTLLGPTGCGKTTFLNLVAGFEAQSEGTLLVDGRPVIGPSPQRGVVFQDPGLYPWLTVARNVELGLRIRGERRRARRARARTFIQGVGLDGFEQHYPHQLSGGMRQRVALARTLINEPRVLLMDEPFAALDAITRAAMQELLLSIWSRTGATVVFVTHDIDEAILLADRVLLMSRRPGRLVQDAAVDLPRPRAYEITTSEAFAAIKRKLLGSLREMIQQAR